MEFATIKLKEKHDYCFGRVLKVNGDITINIYPEYCYLLYGVETTSLDITTVSDKMSEILCVKFAKAWRSASPDGYFHLSSQTKALSYKRLKKVFERAEKYSCLKLKTTYKDVMSERVVEKI